jgi:hypothetical protein
MTINVNLNIHYTAPDWVWKKLDEVYKSMPYYDSASPYPKWEKEGFLIEASVEPSGIQLYGKADEEEWNSWYKEIKEKLTEALGYEIGEPEDGFAFKYEW